MEETTDLTMLNLLMVLNFAKYINTQLGTKIIVDPSGKVRPESSFITALGKEITEDQFKQMALQYGEGMSKFFNVCADITIDSAIAGIANELSGSDPNITLVISN